MNEKKFEQPKNKIGQTPIDQCMDAFYQQLEESGYKDVPEKANQKTKNALYNGVKNAIRMWDIKKK